MTRHYIETKMIKSVGKYGLFLISALALLVLLVGFGLSFIQSAKDYSNTSKWVFVFYAVLIILMLVTCPRILCQFELGVSGGTGMVVT
jgi:bacteriorhodopsin